MKYLGNILGIKLSFLPKYLDKGNQAKNEQMLNQINDLRNDVNKKKILENENPDQEIDIIEKTLDFNE